jgi:hypothetical protein
MNRIHPAIILLVIAVLAYGLLIPQLGFYWDDLPMSWIRYQLGPEAMTRYFSTNRPVWGMLYQVTTRMLPHLPIYWQIFALFWRWLGALVFWGIIRLLWPQREKLALTLSLLFLLYPGFNQQWGSYLYSHFFLVLFFFLLSIYLMLRRKTVLALVFSALNLWMLEYFFILELARPFVIWTWLRIAPLESPQRLRRTLGIWTPYLILFFLAVLSRLFVFNNQIYGFRIGEQFAQAPLDTTLLLLQNAATSLWTVTGAAWSLIFQFPNPATDGPRTSVVYGLVVVLASLTVNFARQKQDEIQENSGRNWGWLIGLGFILLLFGGLPFWLTGVPVSLGFPANRATLAFMLGVSFILAGLLEWVPARLRHIVVVILVGLAAGRQFLWANEFRRDWTYHKNLFWQMTWRAPGLEKATLVLMNEELEYYADNSLGAALNWIYAPDNHTDRVDYVLFYPTNRLGFSLPELQPGRPVKYDYLAGQFSGNTSQSVVFYYSPPGCLRLLDPEIDPANRLIPADSLLREAARLSTTAPITEKQTARLPDAYGPEPVHGWCYYFEKADLARQINDWAQVVRLGEVAFALEDYPNDPLERFVFIEGYAHVGKWEKAKELSMTSYSVSKDYVGPLLCILWNRIERETPDRAEKQAALAEVRTKFDCPP